MCNPTAIPAVMHQLHAVQRSVSGAANDRRKKLKGGLSVSKQQYWCAAGPKKSARFSYLSHTGGTPRDPRARPRTGGFQTSVSCGRRSGRKSTVISKVVCAGASLTWRAALSVPSRDPPTISFFLHAPMSELILQHYIRPEAHRTLLLIYTSYLAIWLK